MRALIDHICAREIVRADDAAGKRLAAVLTDQIAAQREVALFLPALGLPLAQQIATLLRSDPADTLRIRDLAAAAGVSSRTVERAFIAGASMTIGEWRQRARIAHAIALLASGANVKDVALEVGYETPSAFVSAFKKRVGTTPGNTKGAKTFQDRA